MESCWVKRRPFVLSYPSDSDQQVKPFTSCLLTQVVGVNCIAAPFSGDLDSVSHDSPHIWKVGAVRIWVFDVKPSLARPKARAFRILCNLVSHIGVSELLVIRSPVLRTASTKVTNDFLVLSMKIVNC